VSDNIDDSVKTITDDEHVSTVKTSPKEDIVTSVKTIMQ